MGRSAAIFRPKLRTKSMAVPPCQNRRPVAGIRGREGRRWRLPRDRQVGNSAVGCQHSHWITGDCRILDGTEPRLNVDGTPVSRVMFFPVADCEILANCVKTPDRNDSEQRQCAVGCRFESFNRAASPPQINVACCRAATVFSHSPLNLCTVRCG
jgi:hypothetical protein